MSQQVSIRYAGRCLFRTPRRTILSILGIGVACALSLFMVAFVRGESLMMLRAAAGSGIGHLRIVPAGWLATRDNRLRVPGWRNIRTQLCRRDDIAEVTPHSHLEGLLAMGTRSVGVDLVGVDPNTEQAVNRLVRNVATGRYLEPGDRGATVIGQALARRLNVGVDDELMVTATDIHGQMQAAMLRVVGLVKIGSQELESTLCHVTLADVARLSGRPEVGDLTLLLRRPKQYERVQAALTASLPDTVTVASWKDIMPEMASGVKIDQTWTKLIVSIIMIVAFLGIASAQLAAVLERRREFAVLAALGMKNSRLISIMLTEGVILGLCGAVVGLVLGGAGAYTIATYGIDFSRFYGKGDWTMSNMLLDPVFYGEFGPWLIPLSFVLALSATLLSSVYPAWYAARTDPAAALRVDN